MQDVEEAERKSSGHGRDSTWKRRRVKPLVAFSSGPYAACLADGSEYTGSYVDHTSFEQMMDFHRKKLQAGSYPANCALHVVFIAKAPLYNLCRNTASNLALAYKRDGESAC